MRSVRLRIRGGPSGILACFRGTSMSMPTALAFTIAYDSPFVKLPSPSSQVTHTLIFVRLLGPLSARVDQGLVSLNQMDAVRRRFHSTAKSTGLRLELFIVAIQVFN